ncbi:uncharacterized protein GLRG_07853 [Colletotrichum graminicola M1.001]|uniref:Uncharacterized protein n=1 Tax=Colletotrichum graminicola (strain M1.001 / M2 / FGSC 10212) TaxID=645133 RepID=E3QPC1_COLGM|nr:uncharacterized protein GLRG_07853 [Colletotrichum graminicola M1.001]EFQ32709.1 hypothetical protein GLRG_07853 [Colletotrichum graminicola M1.001]
MYGGLVSNGVTVPSQAEPFLARVNIRMWIIGNGAWNGAGTRPAVGREATLQRPRSRRERRRPLNELQYGTAHTKLRLGLLSTGDHIGTHEGTPYVDVKFAPADGDLHLSHSSGGDSPTPTAPDPTLSPGAAAAIACPDRPTVCRVQTHRCGIYAVSFYIDALLPDQAVPPRRTWSSRQLGVLGPARAVSPSPTGNRSGTPRTGAAFELRLVQFLVSVVLFRQGEN